MCSMATVVRLLPHLFSARGASHPLGCRARSSAILPRNGARGVPPSSVRFAAVLRISHAHDAIAPPHPARQGPRGLSSYGCSAHVLVGGTDLKQNALRLTFRLFGSWCIVWSTVGCVLHCDRQMSGGGGECRCNLNSMGTRYCYLSLTTGSQRLASFHSSSFGNLLVNCK